MGKTININNLSKEEINSFYDFVCDSESNMCHIDYNDWKELKEDYEFLEDDFITLKKEIVDHNLFIVSNDVENALYGTLINEKGKIIGEEKNWKQVCQTSRNKSKYKYEASAMDGKYYVFNIKDNNIVDMLEISHDDFLRKY